MTSLRTTRMIALLAALGLGAAVGLTIQPPAGERAAGAPWIGFEELNSNLPAAAEESFDLAALIPDRA